MLPITKHFNPHLPCGRRRYGDIPLVDFGAFQSTPSLRKATFRAQVLTPLIDISIHTFLAEGDENIRRKDLTELEISIHTFLAEGDTEGAGTDDPLQAFQSTPSLRKATW